MNELHHKNKHSTGIEHPFKYASDVSFALLVESKEGDIRRSDDPNHGHLPATTATTGTTLAAVTLAAVAAAAIVLASVVASATAAIAATTTSAVATASTITAWIRSMSECVSIEDA